MFCQKQDALRDAAGHNLSRGGAMRTNLLALAVASALMLTQASVYAVEPVDPAAAPQVVPSASVSAPDSAAPTEASSDAARFNRAMRSSSLGEWPVRALVGNICERVVDELDCDVAVITPKAVIERVPMAAESVTGLH